MSCSTAPGRNKTVSLRGALQRRQEPLDGSGARGLECTIGVDDLDAVLELISKRGGEVVSEPYTIEGVGRLAFFHDTEGNRVGVTRYEATYPL